MPTPYYDAAIYVSVATATATADADYYSIVVAGMVVNGGGLLI